MAERHRKQDQNSVIEIPKEIPEILTYLILFINNKKNRKELFLFIVKTLITNSKELC